MSYSGFSQGNPLYFLDILLKKISQGVLFIRFDGVFLSLNPKAEILLEKKEKEVLLQPFWNHCSDTFFGFSMREALSASSWQAQPCYISQKERKIEVTIHRYYFENAMGGLLLFLEDITKQSKQQELLKRKSRLEKLGEASSIVTHEIKNPLGGIRGYAMLLQRKLEDSSLQAMTQHIIDGTVSLEALLQKILAFVKPNRLTVEKVCLSSPIKNALELVHQDPLYQNIEYKTVFPLEPIYARIDVKLMQQAFFNLFLNALQAMQGEGELCVQITQKKDACVITVSDTGCGIKKKIEKDIFSLFFTTKKEGYGLGLAQTQKIVEEHDGTLYLDRKYKQGAKFSITIPTKEGI